MAVVNALTFDVEDYFHVTGFADRIDPATWDLYELRVELGTRTILDALAAAGCRATFFILGWVARRRPALVREIADAGHEIASHGSWHRRVDTQTPDEFRADVRDARRLLEDLTGRPVTAYRAPSFSITPACRWAFEVLVEEGYQVDSSISPGKRDTVAPGCDGTPFVLRNAAGELTEYPMPAVHWLGRSFPIGGGGYFRLYPYRLTRCGLRAINRAGRPFAVYLHPWEFDAEQPRLEVPVLKGFRHYVNVGRTAGRLNRLLRDFTFGTLTESLEWWRLSPPVAADGLGPAIGAPPMPAAGPAPTAGRSRPDARRTAAVP
jgi:polysaccharide deacetylase family protein (PEP-CTERM system associated)